ncbi:MAG: flagellar hook-associated protein FlgL [Burkholderiales bacterium]
MRISTSMLFERGITGIQRHQSELADLQQKVSAGRRVLKPSDDPIAAAAAMTVRQAQGVNAQFAANAANAQTALGLEEEALSQATRALQDVKTLAVSAGNPALQNADRASLATALQGLYSELLGIANRTDGSGHFLFSGYQASTQPFAESAPGVVAYAGDEGARLMQVGAQRRIAVGDNGAEIFQRIREGNGTFVAAAAVTNAGTAVADTGTVTNGQAWANPANSGDYVVRFHVAPGAGTTYDIVDNATGLSMLTGVAAAGGPHARAYQPGSSIVLQRQAGDPSAAPFDAGVQIGVAGAPADGDTISIRQSGNKDVFATLNDLISTLRTSQTQDPASRAGYQNRLNQAMTNVDRGLDQILTARASVGSRLQEIEALQTSTDDLAIQYEAELSRLQDLDYAQALTELTKRQFNLEAAQKSFMAVSALKLFDLL